MLLLLESFDSFLELEEPEEPPKREVASLIAQTAGRTAAGCRMQAAWLHGCTRETRKIAKWPMARDGPPSGRP